MPTPITAEAQAAVDQFLTDPEVEDATLEAFVIIDLLDKDRIAEASDRIDGWSHDQTAAAALILAGLCVGLRQQAKEVGA